MGVCEDSQGARRMIRFVRRIAEGSVGRSYSLDLRERVVAALEDGMSTRQAAARFSVSIAAVGEWGRRKRAQGNVLPAKQGKPAGSVLDAHTEFILGTLREKPD